MNTSRKHTSLRKFARKARAEATADAPHIASPETLWELVGDPSRLSILDVMNHPLLFGPTFHGPTWDAWRTFLAALFGLPMTEEQLAQFRAMTGRTTAPVDPMREAWVIVGRRGGKSRIAALVAIYLACFRDHARHLTTGERGTIMLLAADRRQARTLARYVEGMLASVPALEAMVESKRKESLDLHGGVTIEVHTASYRSVRGYTTIAAIADEVAFWVTDDDASNPDVEVLDALRPSMATIPDAVLLAISSPYARRGALWSAYESHWAKEDTGVLVWQGPTRAMNPAVPPSVIERAYAADEAAASAEYGAEFRRDVEAFLPREALAQVVIPHRLELPPMQAMRYMAFADPSGGSQDAFTLAIAHKEGDKAVLDAIREMRPPFSPDQVVEEFAALLRLYRVFTVHGDHYAGVWPQERFKAHGITYTRSAKPKSELYRQLLPVIMGGRCELLDHDRLRAQLLGLERRTARGGRDSIDHAPNAHDDVANAVAGVLLEVSGVGQPTISYMRRDL